MTRAGNCLISRIRRPRQLWKSDLTALERSAPVQSGTISAIAFNRGRARGLHNDCSMCQHRRSQPVREAGGVFDSAQPQDSHSKRTVMTTTAMESTWRSAVVTTIAEEKHGAHKECSRAHSTAEQTTAVQKRALSTQCSQRVFKEQELETRTHLEGKTSDQPALHEWSTKA